MTDMKRFNGFKKVKAKPMTRQEYIDYQGFEPRSLNDGEKNTDEGYLVEYQDGGKPNHKDHEGYISWSPKDVFENAYRAVNDDDDAVQYADDYAARGYYSVGGSTQGLSLDQELMRETIGMISHKYADSRTDRMIEDANMIVSAIIGRDSQAADTQKNSELLAERIGDVLGVQVDVTGEFVPCADEGVPAIVNYIQFDGTNDSEVMEFFDGHSGIEGVSFVMSGDIYLSDDTGMHMGKVGDYLVKYSDGSIKLSETCPIDSDVSLNNVAGVNIADSFDFGLAIHCLKAGKKVARAGWNGKGMYVYYVPAASYPVERNNLATMGGIFPDDMVPYREYLALKTAQNDVATWTPSVSDALATDWQIV